MNVLQIVIIRISSEHVTCHIGTACMIFAYNMVNVSLDVQL